MTDAGFHWKAPRVPCSMEPTMATLKILHTYRMPRARLIPVPAITTLHPRFLTVVSTALTSCQPLRRSSYAGFVPTTQVQATTSDEPLHIWLCADSIPTPPSHLQPAFRPHATPRLQMCEAKPASAASPALPLPGHRGWLLQVVLLEFAVDRRRIDSGSLGRHLHHTTGLLQNTPEVVHLEPVHGFRVGPCPRGGC